MPSFLASRTISPRSSARTAASTLDSGSSSRNTLGRRTIARAIATRWRCPPDSCDGRRRSRWSTPPSRAISSTRALTTASSGDGSVRNGKAMFSAIVRCGYSAKSWNTIATCRCRVGRWSIGCPSSRTVPLVAGSSPATMRRMVVLPQPLGPRSTTNSLSATSRSTPLTATVPSSYTLVTPASAMAAMYLSDLPGGTRGKAARDVPSMPTRPPPGKAAMKLKLDLHDIYNRGQDIDRALRAVIDEAVAKKITLVEIIPGKGSGQLKKRVLRFLDQKDIKARYHRVEKDGQNWGRLFIHFRFK